MRGNLHGRHKHPLKEHIKAMQSVQETSQGRVEIESKEMLLDEERSKDVRTYNKGIISNSRVSKSKLNLTRNFVKLKFKQ